MEPTTPTPTPSASKATVTATVGNTAAPTAEPTNITEGGFSGMQTDHDIISTQANSLTLTIAQMIGKREELDKEIYRLGIVKDALSAYVDSQQAMKS